MKADGLSINKVFLSGGDIQYILPYFQREYAWEKTHWQTLLNDVINIYETSSQTASEHFIGALVVIDDGTRSGTMSAFTLVDGQQRLITISLFLCALSNCIDSNSGLHRKIRKFLVNPDENKDLHYKIVPTEKYDDRQAYFSILRGHPVDHCKSRIIEAYNYFMSQVSIKLQSQNIDEDKLFKCIVQSMQVVFIELDRSEQPYKIFESLNAKGKPLTQPDLVRNYIAMRLPLDLQEQVFNKYWAKIEDILQDRRKAARIGELTAFLRHYLSHIAGVLPNKGHVYARFRDRMETEYSTLDQFVGEIKNLYRFADYYDKLLRPENESDKQIREQLVRLNILEISSTYPFLMYLYDSYTNEKISREEFVDTLKILENYMIRRFLANEPTNYLNKMFPALRREIFERHILQSVKAALLNKNYPSDNRLRQRLLSNEIYDGRRQKRVIFVLETLNRYLSKETGGHTVLDGDATIEHIMPQTLNDLWKQQIGDSWETVHKDYLNAIGNLTILTQGWNSSLSNSEFHEKKSRLAQNILLLNKEYFSQDITKWNADAIRERTKYLTDLILEVWPALGEQPELDSVTGTKPTSLTILDESFNVKTWQEVVMQTAETISELMGADDFESLAGKFGRDFKRECLDDNYKKMSNGWWLYIRRSSKDIVLFCKKLVSSVDGLSDKDWKVEYE